VGEQGEENAAASEAQVTETKGNEKAVLGESNDVSEQVRGCACATIYHGIIYIILCLLCVHIVMPYPLYMSQAKDQYAELVKKHKVQVLVPNNWWPGYVGDTTKYSYVVSDVDFKLDKDKEWYERGIFVFKDGQHKYYLNFEGLLGYVDPGTVPSDFSLEDGFPWAPILPVSIRGSLASFSQIYCALACLTPTNNLLYSFTLY